MRRRCAVAAGVRAPAAASAPRQSRAGRRRRRVDTGRQSPPPRRRRGGRTWPRRPRRAAPADRRHRPWDRPDRGYVRRRDARVSRLHAGGHARPVRRCPIRRCAIPVRSIHSFGLTSSDWPLPKPTRDSVRSQTHESCYQRHARQRCRRGVLATCPRCGLSETSRRSRRTSLGYRPFASHACRSVFNAHTGREFNELRRHFHERPGRGDSIPLAE